MSKESKNPKIEVLNCVLVSNQDISHFLGKLKTFIESLGLSERQDKAAKDIIQVMLWDWYTFIRDHNTDHLLEKEALKQSKK